MKCLFAFALVYFAVALKAQPGLPDVPYHFVVDLDHELFRNGMPQYLALSPDGDTLFAEQLRVPGSDSVLSFSALASHPTVPWTIRYLPGGAAMDLYLNCDPSPLGSTVRLHFAQGAYEMDMRRILKCVSDQARTIPVREDGRHGQRPPQPFSIVDTLACHGGRMIWEHGGSLWTQLTLLDMAPFTKRMASMPPSAAREAAYPDGTIGFERFIRAHFSKALIERMNARAKLSALVTIETDGSIHQVDLNGSKYPELDREFKRVLQLSSWWEPAVVENVRNTIDPRSFRYIEQSKVIEYTVDPDSIWEPMPDDWLSILPTTPTSRDSIDLHLAWIGGSCGSYTATTEVLPQEPGKDFREVILRFGAILPAMCEDRKLQSFTHRMAPLPPGRYRLRRLPHPKLPEGGAWAPDPYRVKEFEVR